MSRMSTKPLAIIALLLATTTAIAQVPVLKKPVLAPQAKQPIAPIMPKTPITVVNAAAIVRGSPDRGEAARRLKAQSVPVIPALNALRGAFGAAASEEGRALRLAGYATPDLLVAIKQLDGLDAAAMFRQMTSMGIAEVERGPLLRQLYALDFDALLAAMRYGAMSPQAFGYALDAMDYSVEQMLQAGYRYFAGGFPNPGGGIGPYPGPGQMYDLLKFRNPLAGQVQIDHYVLWAQLIRAGYPPALVAGEVRFGAYFPNGEAADAVARCVASTNLSAGDQTHQPFHVNPRLLIQIAPDGTASHSDQQRRCFVEFFDKLRIEGVSRTVAMQVADQSAHCMPQTNPACPVQLAEVAARMLTEADYPADKH